MVKTIPVTAAFICAISMATLPALTGIASAQEPPSAPTPSEAGMASKDSMKSDSMSKGMKKKHHAKKHKSM